MGIDIRWALLLLFLMAVNCAGSTPTVRSGPLGTSKLYVANSGDNTVSVIDLATHQVVKTIPVGQEPVSLALSPDHSKLVVANKGDVSLSFISTKLDEVIVTRPINIRLALEATDLISESNEFQFSYSLKDIEFGNIDYLIISVSKSFFDARIDAQGEEKGKFLLGLDMLAPDKLELIYMASRPLLHFDDFSICLDRKLICLSGETDEDYQLPGTLFNPGTIINYETGEVVSVTTSPYFLGYFSPQTCDLYASLIPFGGSYRFNVENGSSDKLGWLKARETKMIFSPDGRFMYRPGHPSHIRKSPEICIISLNEEAEQVVPVTKGIDDLELSSASDCIYLLNTINGIITVFDLSEQTETKVISVGSLPSDIIIYDFKQ